MVPDAPRGHPSTFAPANPSRMQGDRPKRMREKKPALKRGAGTPLDAPKDFFAAMPVPKGAVSYGKQEPKRGGGKSRPAKRPTEQSMRSKRAAAAALVVHDGIDASAPVNEMLERQGGAKPVGRMVGFPVSKGKTLMNQ